VADHVSLVVEGFVGWLDVGGAANVGRATTGVGVGGDEAGAAHEAKRATNSKVTRKA
jgi:hypothetical protein